MTLLTEGVARLLLGPAVMVAAAILVKSYADIGDGFSAGVVVALAIACQYLTLGGRRAEAELPMLRHAPRAAIAGMLLAIASGFFPLLFGEPIFSHEPAPGVRPIHIGTLELMTPILFDIGVFLLVAGALVSLLHQLVRVPTASADRRSAPASAPPAEEVPR